MNAKIDAYLHRAKNFPEEQAKLRTIVLDCGLTEELKWGKPCYAFEGKNIVIIQGFKEYCALLFFRGALLKDPDGVLVKTGENTVVGRQMRFTAVKEVVRLKSTIKAYVYQAIEVEKAGLKVDVQKSSKLALPEEFKQKMAAVPALKKAFEALTPGRQRGYNIYFSQPKQAKTRESRVEKCMRQILAGKGLNE